MNRVVWSNWSMVPLTAKKYPSLTCRLCGRGRLLFAPTTRSLVSHFTRPRLDHHCLGVASEIVFDCHNLIPREGGQLSIGIIIRNNFVSDFHVWRRNLKRRQVHPKATLLRFRNTLWRSCRDLFIQRCKVEIIGKGISKRLSRWFALYYCFLFAL